MTVWTHIWAANSPPKLKNFIWKLATNSLAVRANQTRRRMEVSPYCHMCGMVEDTEHMVYRCAWTEAVWFGALGLPEEHKDNSTMEEWLMARRNESGLSYAAKEHRWILCIWLCWMIWRKRCSVVFEVTVLSPMATVGEAMRMMEEYLQASTQTAPPIARNTRVGWRKPKSGYIKLNCDAAWCHRTKQ